MQQARASLPVINLLLTGGADPSSSNLVGSSAQMVARHFRHIVAAELLRTQVGQKTVLVRPQQIA